MNKQIKNENDLASRRANTRDEDFVIGERKTEKTNERERDREAAM